MIRNVNQKKLHELLNKAEESGNDHIVSWLPGGKAFKVHKKIEFTNIILPTLFNATKYKSFQRNLNLWGFDTITEGKSGILGVFRCLSLSLSLSPPLPLSDTYTRTRLCLV